MAQEKELLRDDERQEDRPLSTEDIANADQRVEETNADQRVDETQAKHAAGDPDTPHELFPEQEVQRFRVEWQEIQTRFVDDPREAVQGADQLVAEVMRSLASTFTDHKHELEGQWQQGSEVETEDLRRALQRYRSFFNQLLNV